MEKEEADDTRDDVLQDENVVMVQRLFCYITIAFIPLILISNMLVFWATIFCPHFHTPMNVLLFSLCITDLSMGIFCIPISSLSYFDSTKYFIYNNKYLCLLRFSANWVSAKGSLVNLLFLTVDRYVANTWPVKYKAWITMKTAIGVVVLIWVYILVVAFIPIMGWNNYDFNTSRLSRCDYFRVLPPNYRFYFGYLTVYVCVSLSFILHVILGIKIYMRLRVLKSEYRNMTDENVRAFRETVSTITITVILMFLFIVLWLPYIVIEPFKYFKVFGGTQIEILGVISKLLYFANAVVNAPIYAIARKDYMNTYKLMLKTPPWKWKNALKHLDTKRKVSHMEITSKQSFTNHRTTLAASYSDKRTSENPSPCLLPQPEQTSPALETTV